MRETLAEDLMTWTAKRAIVVSGLWVRNKEE